MTRRRREETYAEQTAREHAQQRIADRFWPSWQGNRPGRIGAAEAVDLVGSALADQKPGDALAGVLGFPQVRCGDALDALQVTAEAISSVVSRIEYTEMQLIETARLAGASWDEIGARHGYLSRPGTHARRRYRTLRAQWPGHTLDPEQEAVINRTDPPPESEAGTT